LGESKTPNDSSILSNGTFQIDDKFINLGSIRQKGGKTVYSWAWCDYKYDKIIFSSNMFEMKMKDSDKIVYYPEIDNWQFFKYKIAKKKINPAQIPFIDHIYTIFNKK
jgi:predicted NUDIX family NTP pyrophosphohydrolase